MKRIADIDLRKKLIVGFVTINMLLIVIGIIGVRGIRVIDNNSGLMYEEYLQSVDDLHQVRGNLMHADVILQYMKQEKSIDGINSLADNVNELVEETSEIITRYEARDMDETEKEPWNKLQQDLGEYRDKRNEIINAMDGGLASANAIDELGQYSKPAYDGIEFMIELNQNLAKEANNANSELYKGIRNIMFISILVAITIAVSLATYLVLYIPSAAKKGLDFALALGEGDLHLKLRMSTLMMN